LTRIARKPTYSWQGLVALEAKTSLELDNFIEKLRDGL
jgi:hypothetical protein